MLAKTSSHKFNLREVKRSGNSAYCIIKPIVTIKEQ